MKKKISLILSLVLLVLAFAGCGSSQTTAANGSGVKVLFLVSSEGDTFRDSLVAAAQSAAEEKGITMDVLYAEDKAEVQLEQMKEAESQGYDAIICRPVNAEMGLQLERAAGKLPVVFVNNCPDTDRLEPDKYVYVGSNEEVAATYQADYVLDQLADKDELNVVIIKGEASHSATKTRTQTVKNILNDSGKKINYVFIDNADWSTDLAEQYYNIFLATGGTADCIVSNNDSMAIGVIDAYKDNNLDPADQLILGIDATTDGCQAIKDGEMSFTVCQSAKGQGAAAVDVAILLGSGKSISGYALTDPDGYEVWVDYEKVDASNVDDYM